MRFLEHWERERLARSSAVPTGRVLEMRMKLNAVCACYVGICRLYHILGRL